MKIKVQHIPSGSYYESAVITDTNENIEKFLEMIAIGNVTHLQLQMKNQTVFFPETVLKDCVFFLVQE